MVSRKLASSIFDLVLPRECPACRGGFEGTTLFCPDCEHELQQLEMTARCSLCSMPVTLPGAPCAQCVGNGLPPFDQIVCLGVMKQPLKTLIHRAKYQGRWELAEQLADRLLQRDDTREMLEHADVVVPVPLHRTKQIQRGYNQAEVVARRISQKFIGCRGQVYQSGNRAVKAADSLFDGTPARLCFVDAAKRVRSTETQTHLPSKAKRTENLRDAFQLIHPTLIEDKHVILVDDVLTTGATLVSLARTINKAGPQSISAIVLAVADPKGRAFEVI